MRDISGLRNMKAGKLIHFFSISHQKKKLFNRKPDYAVFIELPSLSHSRNYYIFKFSLPENSWLLPTSIPTSYFQSLREPTSAVMQKHQHSFLNKLQRNFFIG